MKWLGGVIAALLVTPFALPSGPTLAAEVGLPSTQVLAVASSRSYDTDLPDLRYAATDLARFAGVMTEIGQIPANRTLRLTNPSVAEFRAAIAATKKSRPAKFIFYYSGHSDANGLHLADGLLERRELHELLSSVQAETRIAFLDSCYSGALASKGIRPAQEFQVPKAEFDEPSGSVFLAATGGTEAAFEVDDLRGSLFTHYVVSGLYGQADANADGLVSVDELYQFVYREVSLHNVVLPSGTQKPEYRVDLHGRGALILSFPKQTTLPLVLGSQLQGEVTVASENGLSIQRVQKAAGQEARLSLFPGNYRVIVKEPRLVGRGAVVLKAGKLASLDRADLTYEESGATMIVAKGKGERPLYGVRAGWHMGLMHYSNGGQYVDFDAATPAARIHTLNMRLHGLAGMRQHDLQDGGRASEVELLAGASAAYFLARGLEGQQAFAFLGGGMSRLNEDEGDSARRLKPEVQKIAFALGTSLPTQGGLVWSLEFRREFLFVTAEGAQSDEVLAFAGNQLGLALQF